MPWMSPWISPSICTSPLETRLPLMVRSGPMTDGALRSFVRASPMGRAPDAGCAAAGAKLGGVTFGGSDSDLLKFGNISVHLCSDATIGYRSWSRRRQISNRGSGAAIEPRNPPPFRHLSTDPAWGHRLLGRCGHKMCAT
ncbi:protein of unknown function [Hyphomicrobium sp. 1Nfss2.1]